MRENVVSNIVALEMEPVEVAALEEFLDPAIFDFLFPVSESAAELTPTDVAGPSTSTSSEFKQTNKKELKYLIDLNTNSNTALSTNRFSKWAAERGVMTDIKLIPKADLDGILQQFYAELMKKNGENYEPVFKGHGSCS